MNKMFILITGQKMQWDAAQSFCWRHYGNLASISDELENNEIHDMAKGLHMPFWIGLYENMSSWRWSLKSPWSQFDQQWENNISSSENCASITSSSFWRGRDCTSIMPFFCNDGKKCRAMFCFLFLHLGPAFLRLTHILKTPRVTDASWLPSSGRLE